MKKLTPDEIKEICDGIVENEEISVEEKTKELSIALSEVAQMYNIPLIYSDEFVNKNKEVMEAFNYISLNIAKLN